MICPHDRRGPSIAVAVACPYPECHAGSGPGHFLFVVEYLRDVAPTFVALAGDSVPLLALTRERVFERAHDPARVIFGWIPAE